MNCDFKMNCFHKTPCSKKEKNSPYIDEFISSILFLYFASLFLKGMLKAPIILVSFSGCEATASKAPILQRRMHLVQYLQSSCHNYHFLDLCSGCSHKCNLHVVPSNIEPSYSVKSLAY